MQRYAQAQQHFRVVDKIKIGGSGGWDYASYCYGRLYVAHNDEVVVVDARTKAIEAHIPAHGAHGVAVAPGIAKGYISNGRSNTITIFNLVTNQVIKEVPVGQDPDAIVYDSSSEAVFVMNGHSGSISVIEAVTGDPSGTIELGGSPEFGLADGTGRLFVNLEDKNETLLIDTHSLRIVRHFALTGGEGPTGIAIDRAHDRLFVGCHNKTMLVLNAKTGQILAKLPIGEGVDATAFDPKEELAFSSNRDGTLTVIKEKSPEEFAVQENVKTAPGARTMALDEFYHTIFMPTADLGPAPKPTNEHPKPRPTIVDGTFRLLIVKQK